MALTKEQRVEWKSLVWESVRSRIEYNQPLDPDRSGLTVRKSRAHEITPEEVEELYQEEIRQPWMLKERRLFKDGRLPGEPAPGGAGQAGEVPS